MRLIARYMLISAILITLPIILHAAQIRTTLGDGYAALYDNATGSLICVSENSQRQWRTSVSNSVLTQADWSGVSTSAGPVFVYTSSKSVSYVLMRFANGSTSAEKSGESLRGTVAPGRLVVASWIPQQYGAKVTVVTLDGNKEYTTEMDINMWGTSKKLSQKQRTIQTKREQVPNSNMSIEVPPGFSAKWDESSQCFGLVSSTGLPVGILIHATDGGVDLKEFADIFMRDIGPAMGSSDMKMVGSQSVTVAGLPGLLRIANGSRSDKQATFAFVFVTSPKNTVVMLYLAQSKSYDQYASLFYRLISSVKFN